MYLQLREGWRRTYSRGRGDDVLTVEGGVTMYLQLREGWRRTYSRGRGDDVVTVEGGVTTYQLREG